MLVSSRLTGSNYSLEVQGLDKGWRDAPLPFTGEIQMHDTDAHRFPLELFLSASNFDTLCSVVASPHTPNQLNPARSALPHSLPPKSEYRTTWVSLQAVETRPALLNQTGSLKLVTFTCCLTVVSPLLQLVGVTTNHCFALTYPLHESYILGLFHLIICLFVAHTPNKNVKSFACTF